MDFPISVENIIVVIVVMNKRLVWTYRDIMDEADKLG